MSRSLRRLSRNGSQQSHHDAVLSRGHAGGRGFSEHSEGGSALGRSHSVANSIAYSAFRRPTNNCNQIL